jgi:hypothetical protein|tara:strand:+ start:752 stop:1033 length:282 start_codon:yes stop_codon:yes gene_type:complete
MSESNTKEYEMPLHLQLAMRKAELEAENLTWDQLLIALLNLYHQRLMEIQAIKDLMQDENIELEFDFPSELELTRLLAKCKTKDEDEDDLQPF